MQTWEKKKKAARDLVQARRELGTDGGAPGGPGGRWGSPRNN
jgi:hypothetical protein